MPSPRAATALFIAAEILLLAAAQSLGGWPWTVIAAAAIGGLCGAELRPGTLALLLPGFAWLVLFRVTGNRELFFPFTMHLAGVVVLVLGRRAPWLGTSAGGGIVALFLAIRASQQAGATVLGVEFAVAGTILAVVVAVLPLARGRISREAAVVGLSSLLAYAGLAL